MTDLLTRLRNRVRNETQEIERLNKECFALAANQCHHGYGDEHGNHRCKYQDEIERLRALDLEASGFVECPIVMRTSFTGHPPYVGWRGLGLALTEALNDRDRLRAALRPFALKHQIGAGYGDDDFKRASEAFGTAVLNPKE